MVRSVTASPTLLACTGCSGCTPRMHWMRRSRSKSAVAIVAVLIRCRLARIFDPSFLAFRLPLSG
jgi:hypothetical protein